MKCNPEKDELPLHKDFARIIESWYAQHQRDLPWRGTSNPYHIWISEVILQQTQVAQGYDYYLRFIERFPTVESLAAASEDEVLRLWQGLGYYSRARNMHAAARQIAQQGEFPSAYKDIRTLKGVGDYTAAAIASLAYGLPHAVVDGNVYRVLSRYFGIDTPIDTTEGKKMFAALADSLLDRKNPGTYNQGLMDFGAMQCTPRSPGCSNCPLAASCAALAEATVPSLPVKSKRTAIRSRHLVYVQVVINDEDTLLHRRESGDIWQGLYEPPLLEFAHKPTGTEVMKGIDGLNLHKEGGTLKRVACGVRHQLTHQLLIADSYRLSLPQLDEIPKGFIRVPLANTDQYAMPRLVEILLSATPTAGNATTRRTHKKTQQ